MDLPVSTDTPAEVLICGSFLEDELLVVTGTVFIKYERRLSHTSYILKTSGILFE
jgi:hypothetical protein